MAKTKVHALAKQYGFKSTEFVRILRDIGFPVSSYQASIEEWDLPVIDERLKRGGLIGGDDGANANETGKSAKASSWDSLMKSAAIVDNEKEKTIEIAEVVEDSNYEYSSSYTPDSKLTGELGDYSNAGSSRYY